MGLSQHAVRCHQACSLALVPNEFEAFLRELEPGVKVTGDIEIVPHPIQHLEHLQGIADLSAELACAH